MRKRAIGEQAAMTIGYVHICLELAPPIATVVLNRPQRLNALNLEMAREIRAAVAEVDSRPEIGALLIRGPRLFGRWRAREGGLHRPGPSRRLLP